jgi:LPS export ABC transporter protein LptC
MRRAKLIILVFIVLIGGIAAVSLWVNIETRRNAERREKLPEINIEGVESRLEKIQLVEDKQGKKTWELEAKSIEQEQDTKIMVLEDLKVTYYTKEGRVIVVTGKKGKVNQESKDVEISGNVVLTTSDGYRLRTNSAAYAHEAKKVTTSDPVEIEGDQIRLVGVGMLVDMEAQRFKILSQVKTHIKKRGKG